MANEFKHKDPCTTLTQAEYIGACGDGHIFASQATGDLVIADSATVLKRLARASSGSQMLQIASCKPAWTATPSLGATSWANMNHAHGASCTGGTVCANVLAGTTLKACVVSSSLTSVGTLAALQVDYINANASTVTITDSSDTGDLASLAVTTHGATTLTTTDDDAAAAHFTVDADGNITLDAATGIVTIEDGGTEVLRFTESCSGDVTIKLVTNAKDLIFTDNGDAEGFRILDAAAGVNVAGLLTAGSLDIDNVLINGTTIGHTCDTDLMTVGNAALTVKGTVTVGVDGTGHDVKLFGCAAGAYMEWDESANLLEVRGATAAGPGHLKLTTGELTVVANDVLGRIDFQAPLEADCSADARLVGATIAAVAQGTFGNAVNATDLIFYTGHSEAAAERFRFTSQNEIGIAGANYGTDGQVLTSGGAGAAVAWEDAGGGGVVSGGTDNAILRADGTGGSTSQGSNVVITDAGVITVGAGCGRINNGDGSTSVPSYGFACQANVGFYRASSDSIGFVGNGSAKMRAIMPGGCAMFAINDCANGHMACGITINQGANDDEILTFKSSDVEHDFTCQTDADTYGAFKKGSSTHGGLEIIGFSEGGTSGLKLRGAGEASCNGDSTSAVGGIHMLANDDCCGTDFGARGCTENLVSFSQGTATVALVKGNGDLHTATGSITDSFDAYCDVALLTAARGIMASCKSPDFKQSLSIFVDEYGCVLEQSGVVALNRDTDSVPFMSHHAMFGLIIDTIRQVGGRVAGLETELKALQGGCK